MVRSRPPPAAAPPQKFGRIVDEPRVGQELAEVYWAPGNGQPFLDLVKKVGGQVAGQVAGWLAG